jgi:putative transposase
MKACPFWSLRSLFSRQEVALSMWSDVGRELVLNGLLMAVWWQQLENPIVTHSDQDSHIGSHDWRDLLDEHHFQ